MQQSASTNLRLRALTRADIPFADFIRALAGWNQTLADWERFLETEPGGCFLAEWDGEPAGTATTTVYGTDLAWIGMVLVHPQFRRRGIGTSLLRHCISYLQQERGVRCIKLDATPEGKLVYDRLGFQSEWSLKRYEGILRLSAKQHPNPPVGAGIRSWNDTDPEKVVSLDTHAFGVSRQPLLRSLAQQSLESVVVQNPCGEAVGYGFARTGVRATYLGPIGASSPEAGALVAQTLLGRLTNHRIFWDIPDATQPAIDLVNAHGLTVQRSLIRMFLGPNSNPGNPRAQFALAGPEVG